MQLLYPFPELFPIQKARGIQVAHTLFALAQLPVKITFAYVPIKDYPDPFVYYGFSCPKNIRLLPIKNTLPFPISSLLKIRSGHLFFWRLSQFLKKESPSFIFVRHLKLAHRLISAFPHFKIIYEAHEIFSNTVKANKKKALETIEKTVLLKSHHVICITHALKNLMEDRYRMTIEASIVPSATKIPQQIPSKKKHDLHKEIVYSGSLYDWKGAEDLLYAAAFLPEHYHIQFIGGEPEKIEFFQKIIPKKGARLSFLGHLPHSEIEKRLSRFSIAILPNRSGSVSAYTSPLKLFEYMASGCAIVASDLPVFHEILMPSEAAWFEAGNPKALAHAIISLVENPEQTQRLGELMRKKAENYTWEARAKKLITILTECQNENNRKNI